MKRIILISLLFLSAIFSSGQDKKATSDSVRLWTDGPLTWQDFCVAGESSSLPSYAFFKWHPQQHIVKKGHTTYKYTEMTAAIDKASYIKDWSLATDSLRYKWQTAFDIQQAYARRYTNTLMTGRYDKKQLMDELHTECIDVLNKFESDSSVEFPPIEDVVDPESVAFKQGSYVFWIGAYAAVPVGPTTKLASFLDGLCVSGGYRYKRFTADATISMTLFPSSSNIRGYYTNYGWQQYYEITYLSAIADFGYQFINGERFKMNAFAGAGYGQYQIGQLAGDKYSGPMLNEGIGGEFLLHSFIDLNGGDIPRNNLSLWFRIYSEQMFLLQKKATLPSIGFSFGIKLDGASLL